LAFQLPALGIIEIAMRPPSVGTETVADVPVVFSKAASPVTREAGTWRGSVPSREASREAVAHGFIPASQAGAPPVVWTQAVANAEAAVTGECASAGADVSPPALAEGATDAVVETLVSGLVGVGTVGAAVLARGNGAAAETPWPPVIRPNAAMTASATAAEITRLRQDHSGQRTARLHGAGLIPRSASAH
jgi:hypothetical protein